MKRFFIFGLALLVLIGGFAYVKREALMLDYLASKTPKSTLAELQAFINPHIVYYPPENAEPPYKTVIQFHGCAGMRENFMAHWAAYANAAGYMAVAVDSHGPRDIDYDRAITSVCAGKELIGQERAGDILAALTYIAKRDDVDAENLVIAGWSHGAWSVMDLLAMDIKKRQPSSLSDKALSLPKIAGVLLFYPYCGEGGWTRVLGWAHKIPTISFIAGKDTIVNGPECKATFEKLSADGADVEIVYYPEADHVFDDPTLKPKYLYMYDETAAKDAASRYQNFLTEIPKN